jgi:DNA-binding transcriptional MocR family regulator
MPQPLYRQVAERIANAIQVGTYRPGDRLPSVRSLARDWEVGINTVIEAYRALELEGVIAARPQAGFFVRGAAGAQMPATQCTLDAPTAVTMGELAMRILTDGSLPGVVSLGVAWPDPAKLPQAELTRVVQRLLRDDPAAIMAYATLPGEISFRSAVAKHWLSAGCQLHPDEIVATCGALEALVLALRATCPPGAVVAVESPTYYGVLQVLNGLGLRAVEIPSSAQDGMELGALRFALAEHAVAAVLVIPNFSNPSGSLMPDSAKRELAEMCAARGIPLIEDDVYGDLAHDGSRPAVCKGAAPDDVILCGSFSKTVSPGLRLGFCAGGRWAPEIARLKAATSITAPTLAQRAVAHLLTSGAYDRHVRRVRPLYARTCQAMSQAIIQAFPAGTRLSRPQGGYVLWVELPEGIDAVQLYEAALPAGISTAPGPLFSARGRYGHCLRLTCSVWDAQRQAAVATLGQLAAKLARRAG